MRLEVKLFMIDNLVLRNISIVVSVINHVALKQRLVWDDYVNSLVLLVVLKHDQSNSCDDARLTRACRDFPQLSPSLLQLCDGVSTDCTLHCV